MGGGEGEGEVGVTDCDDLHCSALVRLSPRYRYTTCLHHSATTLPSASLPHRNKQQSTWSLTHSNQIISQGSALKSIVRARNALISEKYQNLDRNCRKFFLNEYYSIVTGLRPVIERSVTQQKKRFCGKCVLFVLRFLMVTGTFQLLSSGGTIACRL